jgi:two-component system chemotaxis response regulator CheB
MPEGFTRSFAARLDSLCAITVKEAEDNERVQPGHAYIAPGHSNLMLKKSGGSYATLLTQAEPVNRHRPSVDVLFRSAARSGGHNVLAVILTGMGKDGAAGMVELQRAGAYTYAQDEASCVVFGMPKEAIAQGGVNEVLPLDEIAAAVLARLAVPSRASRV